MYTTVGIAALALVVDVVMRSQLRSRILKHYPYANPAYVSSVLNRVVAEAFVFDLVWVTLYLLLIWQVSVGKQWARVVAIVLASLGAIGDLANTANSVSLPIIRLLALVGVLTQLSIIYLLSRSNRDYFR